MKKLIVIALGLLTAAALYAQDFGGWQMPKIEMQYSQKYADVNYTGYGPRFQYVPRGESCQNGEIPG